MLISGNLLNFKDILFLFILFLLYYIVSLDFEKKFILEDLLMMKQKKK